MRIRTAAMFAAGYVLGSRAGRNRYGQIVTAARKASGHLDHLGRRLEQLSDRMAARDR
jgi:hypothetical protein